MQPLSEEEIFCPYCSERISVLIEVSTETDEYIEDCQVCCRPIVFHIEVDEMGEQSLSVRAENDVW